MTLFSWHHETTVVLPAPPGRVFEYLDDFRQPSAHMEEPSAMATLRELPYRKGWQTVLGLRLGTRYARWCTERMARDALNHFGEPR